MKSQKNKFQNVVLIGVGLIGGSLTWDLLRLKLCQKVIGYGRDVKNLKFAKKQKIISDYVNENQLSQVLSESDFVIFATPVKTTKQLVKKYSQFISQTALVIDVGSTKNAIVEFCDKFFPKGNFVACHPMAGKETSGAKACEKGFFKEKTCIITPSNKTSLKFKNQAKTLWKSLGAKLVEMSGVQHDKNLALTSHLPQAISSLLMNAIGQNAALKDLLPVIGNGFKDTTRIAASHGTMWAEIFLENQKNILQGLDLFEAQLKDFKKALKNKDESALFVALQMAANFRKKIK